MRNSSPTYEPLYTEQFEEIVSSTKKRQRPMLQRIETAVEKVLEAPENHDGWLSGRHAGKLKKYVGRSEYRLVYAVCGLCRKLKHTELNRCDFCEETTDNTVVFFWAGAKKDRHGDYDL